MVRRGWAVAAALALVAVPQLGTRHQSGNLAHRCGCSTVEGPRLLLVALALARVPLLLRRR